MGNSDQISANFLAGDSPRCPNDARCYWILLAGRQRALMLDTIFTAAILKVSFVGCGAFVASFSDNDGSFCRLNLTYSRVSDER